ncbi:unnamed protein product [Mycena citricolor]|uniref:DUF6534 domain-containing protein n=1 Tax=Mycena citricolor TaxID=2018698 RepID=A0AAD2HU48_9AGAR|nr:unnamed protein product [Mycena citricolor]
MSSPQQFVNYALGGWELAVCSSLLLQGVLLGQTARYLANGFHRTDPTIMRVWVAGLLVLSLGRNLFGIQLMYEQDTAHYLNFPAALGEWLSARFDASFLISGVLVYYVQMFFCWRLWTLCRQIWLPSAFALLFSAGLVCSILAVPLAHMKQPVRWAAAYLSVYFVSDFLLCGSMMFFLLRDSRSQRVSRDTATVLNRIARITIQSALPSAACALALLASSQKNPDYVAGNSALAITVVLTQLLPMSYAYSAMWTLNARKGIRAEMTRSRDATGTDQSGWGAAASKA